MISMNSLSSIRWKQIIYRNGSNRRINHHNVYSDNDDDVPVCWLLGPSDLTRKSKWNSQPTQPPVLNKTWDRITFVNLSRLLNVRWWMRSTNPIHTNASCAKSTTHTHFTHVHYILYEFIWIIYKTQCIASMMHTMLKTNKQPTCKEWRKRKTVWFLGERQKGSSERKQEEWWKTCTHPRNLHKAQRHNISMLYTYFL